MHMTLENRLHISVTVAFTFILGCSEKSKAKAAKYVKMSGVCVMISGCNPVGEGRYDLDGFSISQ